MEEWETKSGSRFYIQGAFVTKESVRKEPYIIVIMRKASSANEDDLVLWSGPNLHDGKDIYASHKRFSSANPKDSFSSER